MCVFFHDQSRLHHRIIKSHIPPKKGLHFQLWDINGMDVITSIWTIRKNSENQ